jgi:hypothetical protein
MMLDGLLEDIYGGSPSQDILKSVVLQPSTHSIGTSMYRLNGRLILGTVLGLLGCYNFVVDVSG